MIPENPVVMLIVRLHVDITASKPSPRSKNKQLKRMLLFTSLIVALRYSITILGGEIQGTVSRTIHTSLPYQTTTLYTMH